VEHERRRAEPVLITDAAEDPEVELRRREIRYVAMMLFRALCLIAAAFIAVQKPPLWGLWVGLCVLGAVVLPWMAVVIANDRPPRKRQPIPTPTPQLPTQTALPVVPHDRIIDAD
jgi:Protein of unknown function (DUF3099)